MTVERTVEVEVVLLRTDKPLPDGSFMSRGGLVEMMPLLLAQPGVIQVKVIQDGAVACLVVRRHVKLTARSYTVADLLN